MKNPACFRDLEDAYDLSRLLFEKGVDRISINPNYSLYNDRVCLSIFLHIDYKNGENKMFQFESSGDLLNKIFELTGE